MEYFVAKTVEFDRNAAIQAREMFRIAEGESDQSQSRGVRSISNRLKELISFGQQAPLSFSECGGAPA